MFYPTVEADRAAIACGVHVTSAVRGLERFFADHAYAQGELCRMRRTHGSALVLVRRLR
jgi:hypothetical protein